MPFYGFRKQVFLERQHLRHIEFARQRGHVCVGIMR